MNLDVAVGQRPPRHGTVRRSVLRRWGGGALATGTGSVLAACTNNVDLPLTKSTNLEPTNADAGPDW
jgi:hypothetical protein